MLKIAALAGGVGGAKLTHGLYQVLPAGNLTVIVNTGDDFDHYGLHVCPDLDTVCYTLAGMANPDTGWGLQNDTFQALEAAASLGGPGWFKLGDRDLGTHLERTRRLQQGENLSEITAGFCERWQVSAQIVPMTDGRVSTLVHTLEGSLPFQEYFVHRRCEPAVSGFTFENLENTQPCQAALQAVKEADAVIICPSNPWVSIGPILAYQEISSLLEQKLVVAVSPIVAGKALRGPAAKMYRELGQVPSAVNVARHYSSMLSGFVLDTLDAQDARIIDQSGIISLVTNTIMRSITDRRDLASRILDFLAGFDRRLSPG